MVRYTDDFLIFGDDRAALGELKSLIIEELAKVHLLLAEPKSRLLATREGVPFCGFRFLPGQRPRVLGATKRRFEQRKHRRIWIALPETEQSAGAQSVPAVGPAGVSPDVPAALRCTAAKMAAGPTGRRPMLRRFWRGYPDTHRLMLARDYQRVTQTVFAWYQFSKEGNTEGLRKAYASGYIAISIADERLKLLHGDGVKAHLVVFEQFALCIVRPEHERAFFKKRAPRKLRHASLAPDALAQVAQPPEHDARSVLPSSPESLSTQPGCPPMCHAASHS